MIHQGAKGAKPTTLLTPLLAPSALTLDRDANLRLGVVGRDIVTLFFIIALSQVLAYF
jgi:hypothetical protein